MIEREKFEEYASENPNELTREQLEAIRNEMKHPVPGIISDEYLDFKLWCRHMPSRQECFADFIEKMFPLEHGKKMLEAGAGRTARLSRLLAEKGYQMTAMDPLLEVGGAPDAEADQDKAAGARVERIQAAFDYRTVDLTGFDCVVAQEPCEATEHVIRAATGQGVPFIMVLCGVPHKLISGEMPEDVYAWYDYLQEIAGEAAVLIYDPLYGKSKTAVMICLAPLGQKEEHEMLFVEYPKCSTCKKAKNWLDSRGISYSDRHIKEENPTVVELRAWHEKSGLPLKRFFNTSGNLYKEMKLKDRLPSMSEEEQYELLATDGMLVKRPIVVTEDTVLVGFKEAEWEEKL